MFDYLIIGQGLAGTVLAHTIQKEGKSVYILDKENPKAAYKVSAGIVNPITGKRINKTWMAEALFPFLFPFYEELEQLLGHAFVHRLPVYKPFSSILEQNEWLSKAFEQNYAPFIDTDIPKPKYENYVYNEYGGFETRYSGYIDVVALVERYRAYLSELKIYRKIERVHLELYPDHVSVNEIKAKRAIFCEGASASENPYFSWLPFRFSKGQILEIESDQLSEEVILNKGAFVVPLGDNRYRAGSTYENKFENTEITDAATKDIRQRLDNMLKVRYRITGATAGIRPAVVDRKPLIGIHPEIKTIGIFNGLGTKGVSLAPYFARRFYKHLEEGEPLDPEVAITRFMSLYPETSRYIPC